VYWRGVIFPPLPLSRRLARDTLVLVTSGSAGGGSGCLLRAAGELDMGIDLAC